jgi:hypothetical protein
MVFTHRPLHTVKPPGQLHWALVQRWPPVHRMPQPPQLFSSELKLVHWPPQEVKAVQFWRQLPPMHDCPAGQAVPQVPQFCGSVVVLVQTPVQLLSGAGHEHCPSAQT